MFSNRAVWADTVVIAYAEPAMKPSAAAIGTTGSPADHPNDPSAAMVSARRPKAMSPLSPARRRGTSSPNRLSVNTPTTTPSPRGRTTTIS